MSQISVKWIPAVAALILTGVPAFGHRLDEYLQASLISLATDHVQVAMRLQPGVATASAVLASVDVDSNGEISKAEQQEYADRVLGDLILNFNGRRLIPRLQSVDFPSVQETREGLGEINIAFSANLPAGRSNNTLVFENHHQPAIGVYLINSLVPEDHNIEIISQHRNEPQSIYQVEYAETEPGVRHRDSALSSIDTWRWLRMALSAFDGFGHMFKLGMHHIAEGVDHLLFLLTLLLSAPLVAGRARWGATGSVRACLGQILRVATAFTIGHSTTLLLAALGIVHVPTRPIEVLIAVSIFISAVHAIRPLFPGREIYIAGFFGLIHGLAFAATLTELGLGSWERIVGIGAFNLGIEGMQLVVIAAVMPSLVLLSRTKAYGIVRIGSAAFAGVAAIGWVGERMLDLPNFMETVVAAAARCPIWLAGTLFMFSILCWKFWRSDRPQLSNERLVSASVNPVRV